MKNAVAIDVRPYRDDDEARVLEVLDASLGGGPAGKRPPEFFRWKHLENPFGQSLMLIAESDGRIAGLRAFMRWRFLAGDRVLQGVRAVDTATHPDFQGKGVFQRLTLEALDVLRSSGTDFVFNTPNPASLQGYLKMGWTIVAQVPIRIRVCRPIRFLRGLRKPDASPAPAPSVDAPSAEAALADPGVADLLAEATGTDGRIHTARDAAYLRWRYGSAPLLGYRAIVTESGGRPSGVALFRVRPRDALWETTLSEIVVRPGDAATARRLLTQVRRAAGVDHVACHFADGTTAGAAARRSLYLRANRGMTFVVNPLHDHIVPDPLTFGSWALSIGDLEVF